MTWTRTGERVKRHTRWYEVCVCSCPHGTRAYIRLSGAGLSSNCCRKCGNRGGKNARHGYARLQKSRTWIIWHGVKMRCDQNQAASYARYAGRGIKLCDRWHTFENFLADMGEAPDGRSLDRIDNDGNYEPGNCRWATRKEQARNTSTNTRITFNGRIATLVEWSEVTGISRVTISRRISRGWSVDEALTKPVRKNGPRTVSLTPNVQ